MMKNTKWSYYYQLLEVFTIREIKSRYRASLLGPIWIILYPMLTALVLYLVFGIFVKIETENSTYFLFLLSGLLVWNYFQQVIILSKDVFIWNRELVLKTNFPKDTLPLSYVLSKLPDYFIFQAIFYFLFLISGHSISSLHLWLLLLPIPLLLLSCGISLVVSLSNAIFRDFGRLIDFLLMLLFYATPIVYPEKYIPAKYIFLTYLNPLSLILGFERDLLFKGVMRTDLFFLSMLYGLAVLAVCLFIYRRLIKYLPDLI